MIIYSVTVSVDAAIESEWKQWMQSTHIPDVLATEMFETCEMLKLLDPVVDSAAVTFSIQYRCKSMAEYEKYQEQFAPKLQEEHTERYKDKFVAFRTILEVVA